MESKKTGNSIKAHFSHFDMVKRLLIFIALVAITAIGLRPLQLGLLNRMEMTKDAFLRRAEEYSGYKIKYGSMGPSIFGVLDIRDVLILRKDESILLSISKLRLSYSLLSFLKGETREIFRSARIDKPVISIDFEKDSFLSELLNSLSKSNAGANSTANTKNLNNFFPDNFSIQLWDGEWIIAYEQGEYKLSGLRLEAAIKQNRISFQGRWDASATILKMAMSGRISGEFFQDSGEGSASVLIPSFYGENFKFKPLEMNVLLSDGLLEMRKAYDRLPAAVSLVYDIMDGGFHGHIETENFAPEELLGFTGLWNEYNPWLGIKISGSSDFNIEKSGSAAYKLAFRGSAGDTKWTGAPVYMVIKADGDNSQASIDTLEFGSPFGNLKFNGHIGFLPGSLIPLAPDGALSLSNFSLRLHEGMQDETGISGDIVISTQGKMINLFGENFSAGKAAISSLDASVYQDEQGLSYILTALKSGETRGDNFKALSLEGSMDYNPKEKNQQHLRASLALDSFLVGDILAFMEPLAPFKTLPPLLRSAADDLSITTEVFFTTDYEHILYNAPGFSAAYNGITNVMVNASLSGTNRGFELSSGLVSWDNGAVDIACSVDYSDANDVTFSMNAVHKDISYFLEGMILDQRNISVRGSYGLLVNLSSEKNSAYSGYVQVEMIPIPSGDKYASLSFLSTLFYDSPSSWQAKIEKFELSGLTTPASSSTLIRFTGEASERGLFIPDILLDDGRGTLQGDININWDTDYNYFRCKSDLFGSNNNEYYGLYLLFRDKRLELSFSGQGMQLSRISSKNALADGSLRLSWESPSSFEAEAELSSLVMYLDENTIRASAALSADSEIIDIEHLTINYSGVEASIPFLKINRFESRAETELVLQGDLAGRPLDLSLRGEALFNHTETWLDIAGKYGFIDAFVLVDTARYDTIEADEPFSFTLNLLRETEGTSINLIGGPRNMLRLSYNSGIEDEGIFYAALSAPSPVRGSLTGTIDSKNIDAQATDLYVDMGSLWRFIPPSVDVVKFPGGIVTGSVRISGPLDDPGFYGTAQAKSIQILVPDFLPEPIRPVPATFLLNGNEMVFGPIGAAVGKGGGMATGWFRFEQWIPRTFIIDIQVPNETPIPYGFDLSGLMAHGLASGRLVITLEDLVFYINGELSAHNAEISFNANELTDFENGLIIQTPEGKIPAVTDLSIKAGRRVEFFWPTVDFPILQANADMGTGIHVKSDTAAGRLALTGNVKLRSGEIFYLERNFYIREGTLFLNETETRFNPLISARAEIRDQSEDGPVTISMIIENAPLMTFSPRFESNPPLSQLEIYALLGQNPQGETGTGQRIVASAALDSIAQFVLIQRFQRQVRDLLGLDMFSIRTQVFQNMALQVTNTQTRDTGERTYRVGNYFDNTTVFIGKYFGADIFGDAMLSLRYDETNPNWGGMRLEPELGLEMRNPLFDIRFNIIPQNQESWFENWLIDSVSFSLVWRKTISDYPWSARW